MRRPTAALCWLALVLTGTVSWVEGTQCGCTDPQFTKNANGNVVPDTKDGALYEYPPEYGTYCVAHDKGRAPYCNFTSATNKFCQDSWCYVDPCTCQKSDLSQTVWYQSLVPTGSVVVYSYANCAGCSSRTKATCSQHGSCTWRAGVCQEQKSRFDKAYCDAASTDAKCNTSPANKVCKWTGTACVTRSYTEKRAAFGCATGPASTTPPPIVRQVKALEVYIYDGVTYADPLVGATVAITGRAGSKTLDQSGRITFDVTTFPDPVTLTTTMNGYVMDVRTIRAQDCSNRLCSGSTSRETIFLSPKLTGTTLATDVCTFAPGPFQVRAILSWGKNPADLDAVAMVRSGLPCSKVYYSIQECRHQDASITLDVDVTNGFGPETISMSNLPQGTVQYVVYRYSGTSVIADSDAVLRVYIGSKTIECRPSADCVADFWAPFDLSVVETAVGKVVSMVAPSFVGGCTGGCSEYVCAASGTANVGAAYPTSPHIVMMLFALATVTRLGA